MFRASLVAVLAGQAWLAAGAPDAEEHAQQVLRVSTYDWRPDTLESEAQAFAAAEGLPPAARVEAEVPLPAMRVTTRTHASDEHESSGGGSAQRAAAKRSQLLAARARAAAAEAALSGKRRLATEEEEVELEAVWDRPQFRSKRFELTPSEGEHPCFAGFKHMVENTDRCNGWVREYPPVGESRVFLNTGVMRDGVFTLKAVVGGYINVWLEEGSTEKQEDISIKAAKIFTNEYGIDELRPSPESASWMEHECKIMGSMPFMYTCSNRINVLVQECKAENAWVISTDYLQNYPGPATADSPTNHDIIFYMCQELLNSEPNPYAAANTFAHELAHVIQGGFGFSQTTMAEGGATWLEGPLLNLSPRPMVYAWGFSDWNSILASHIYATEIGQNARKFYQIHGMFLAYLAQPQLLGTQAASALQNYETFDPTTAPFGRSAFEYFLTQTGRGTPSEFTPLTMSVEDVKNPFAEALLNYRVALASQCILNAESRPSEPEYQLPELVRDRPYWDCSSFPTYWSHAGTSVQGGASTGMHYGGAAVARLMLPETPSVSMAADADPFVRTKVIAAGVPGGPAAEVRELRPGETASFQGAREIYIVQVNVDPAGEAVGPDERQKLWRRTTYRCNGPCQGSAWWAGSKARGGYASGQRAALQTALIELPSDADGVELTFVAMWDMEVEDTDGSEATEINHGCFKKAWDGVQLRAVVVDAATGHESMSVLEPDGGYGTGPKGESAVASLVDVYPVDVGCASFDGWSGSSGKNFTWRNQRVSLQQFAGQTIRLEWLFVSDLTGGAEGFWVDRIRVQSASAVFFEGHETEMREHFYFPTPTLGNIGEDGVPVVAVMPEGYVADKELLKEKVMRSAPWTAVWTAPEGSGAALTRAYLGLSYAAPASNTKTALLHPRQEACVPHTAPFRGQLRAATLFTLVDKIGVDAVSLSLRSAAFPHARLDGSRAVVSASYGVQDPGMHRFVLEGNSPTLEKGAEFFVCIGIAGVKPLPADDPAELPFLHLALTTADGVGQGEVSGAAATLLYFGQDAQEVGAGPRRTRDDPWNGHSLTLRAEFIQVPKEAPTVTAPVATTGEAAAAAANRGHRRLRG